MAQMVANDEVCKDEMMKFFFEYEEIKTISKRADEIRQREMDGWIDREREQEKGIEERECCLTDSNSDSAGIYTLQGSLSRSDATKRFTTPGTQSGRGGNSWYVLLSNSP